MLKMLGAILMLSGVAGVLYSWICEQKEMQKNIEELLLFLKKSKYVMGTERIKVAYYLERYANHAKVQKSQKDTSLEKVLKEIVKRLSTNTYPNGQEVWEEVFREEKEMLHVDSELFQIIVQAGNGFFGRSREENIQFLQKSIKELEQKQAKMKEKQAQERKVWIPVGMLGSVMLIIVFL